MIRSHQLKNSIIYLLPKVIAGLLPLLTLPIFTSVLSKSDFGVFALAEVYAIFATGIVNFGLTAGYERNFFQYTQPLKRAQLLYSTLLFVSFTFLLALAGTFIFRFQLSRLIIGSSQYANLLFFVFCSTVVMSFKQYYLIYFKNMEEAKEFSVYSIDETILGVVFSLILVAYFRTGVVGMAWGQLAASIIILAVLMVRFVKILPVSLKWDVLLDSLKISYPLTPRIFLGVISTQLNKYILGVLNSMGGVGIFSIGQKIANVVFIYMTAIQNVFNPQVYKKMFLGSRDAGREIGTYLTPFIYFSVIISLLIALFSEEIVRILTPPAYSQASIIVIILSMYYAALFFGKITGTQLIFMRKTWLTSLLSFVDIGISILCCVFLIGRFGIIGAAWATLIAGLVSTSISLIVAQRFYKIDWEYAKIIAIFSVFYVSAILMIFLMSYVSSYWVRFGLKAASLLLYLLLGIRVGLITRENIALIKDLIQMKKGKLIGNEDIVSA